MAPQVYQFPEARQVPVYGAGDFVVQFGANENDGFGCAALLVAGDVYALTPAAEPKTLSLTRDSRGFAVARTSETGQPERLLHLDSIVTFMDQNARMVEVLLLIEIGADGRRETLHAMPMAPLHKHCEYTLTHVQTKGVVAKLNASRLAAFVKGTRVTLASGAQIAVEDLAVGDQLLTRDVGTQPIQELRHHTRRAAGLFAPVRIAAGTLGNAADLLVAQDHRLYFYQRHDRLGTGQSEVMVRAQHLVNGHSVTVEEGGFVDYVEIVFETHQVIYAEGVATESTAIAGVLEPDVDRPLENVRPTAPTVDVSERFAAHGDAVTLLKSAFYG